MTSAVPTGKARLREYIPVDKGLESIKDYQKKAWPFLLVISIPLRLVLKNDTCKGHIRVVLQLDLS